MEVKFKIIDGYEFYGVTNDGFVINVLTKRVLKQDNVKGYLRVTLSKNNNQKRFTVHRLVAINFIPNPENKKYVNHIDGDKTNNKENNLEWVTSSENERHSYLVLGKVNFNRKLNNENVIDILENAKKGRGNSFKGNVDFYAEKYNVDRSTILNVLKRKYYA